jgi:hypothetical protein
MIARGFHDLVGSKTAGVVDILCSNTAAAGSGPRAWPPAAAFSFVSAQSPAAAGRVPGSV